MNWVCNGYWVFCGRSNIINDKEKQTIKTQELEEQIQSFLTQYNDKIEQIVINELLYQDLRNEVNKLKEEKQEQITEEELLNELLEEQSIESRINNIKEDEERLQKQKEHFVRYNLLSRERLFKDCGKQFNRDLSETIVNEGNVITVVELMQF